MIETELDIVMLVADGTLLVSVQFAPGASREAIKLCLFKIASAFAGAEQIREKELPDLVWERKRTAQHEDSFVVRRSFSDPAYPQRFEAELRRIDETPRRVSIH
jgi:hypothetical protein